jgi:hypothetical protein
MQVTSLARGGQVASTRGGSVRCVAAHPGLELCVVANEVAADVYHLGPHAWDDISSAVRLAGGARGDRDKVPYLDCLMPPASLRGECALERVTSVAFSRSGILAMVSTLESCHTTISFMLLGLTTAFRAGKDMRSWPPCERVDAPHGAAMRVRGVCACGRALPT